MLKIALRETSHDQRATADAVRLGEVLPAVLRTIESRMLDSGFARSGVTHRVSSIEHQDFIDTKSTVGYNLNHAK